MEQQIRFCTTSDGVRIAYAVVGEGPPLVHLPWPGVSHVEAEWQWPQLRSWYERLGRTRTLVRFDWRGWGLSDHPVAIEIDGFMMDLDAIADEFQPREFALFGPLHFGPVAIAYACRRPERVSHLILWCSWANPADFYKSPQAQTLGSLRDKDWETYSHAIGLFFAGWSDSEAAHRYADLIRKTATQEELVAGVKFATQFDASELLPEVTTQTLVLHSREFRMADIDMAKNLVTGIRGARLVVVGGESIVPTGADAETVATAVEEFLGIEGPSAPGQAKEPSALVTILFTDMEGSTSLTQRLGDDKAQEVLREHNAIVREALKAHAGSEIKHTGDGIMASFASASGALDCAVAIQRAFAERNAGVGAQHAAPLQEPVRVRIGLNAGEPVAEESDLFGSAVQLAARVCAAAEPGRILVSNVVRELAMGKGHLFSDVGEVALRGFEDPVRLYEVKWED